MTTVGTIILKSFHETRPKLAAVLNVGERRALTKAMFEDVTNAAQGCPELSQIAVVSPEDEVLVRPTFLIFLAYQDLSEYESTVRERPESFRNLIAKTNPIIAAAPRQQLYQVIVPFPS